MAALSWAMSDFDKGMLHIEVDHLYKGKRKSPHALSSFRPIGLAEPTLTVLVELLFGRVRPHIVLFCGVN